MKKFFIFFCAYFLLFPFFSSAEEDWSFCMRPHNRCYPYQGMARGIEECEKELDKILGNHTTGKCYNISEKSLCAQDCSLEGIKGKKYYCLKSLGICRITYEKYGNREQCQSNLQEYFPGQTNSKCYEADELALCQQECEEKGKKIFSYCKTTSKDCDYGYFQSLADCKNRSSRCWEGEICRENCSVPNTPEKSASYPLYKQDSVYWGNCYRCSNWMAKSGCADVSLAMILSYWYDADSSIRQKWDKLKGGVQIPYVMDHAGSYACNSSFNNGKPDPYDLLFFMNNKKINLSDCNWDLTAMKNFLGGLGLKFASAEKSLSFEEVKNYFNSGKSILLFCDMYGRDFRSCTEGNGAQPCNHYLIPVGFTANNMLVNDPGFEIKSISPELYKSYQCGEYLNSQDHVFFIYP